MLILNRPIVKLENILQFHRPAFDLNHFRNFMIVRFHYRGCCLLKYRLCLHFIFYLLHAFQKFQNQ